VCTTYTCNGKVSGDSRCTAVPNPCTEKKKANPGTCREVRCSASVSGGCYVQLNHALCKTRHGNACLEYECTPEGQTPDISETGCRLKTNKTKIKEDELKKNGKISCFAATCDSGNGVVGEKDICKSSNDKCFTSSCQSVSGAYKCVEKEKDRPSDTKCKTYSRRQGLGSKDYNRM